MTRTWMAAALLTTLVGVGAARAETPTAGPATARAKRAGKVPFRAVRLMPETQQALIYDRDQREHRVVKIGDVVGAYQVVDIDDDELVLTRDGREIVLVVDPTAPAPPVPSTPSTPSTASLLDPYAAGEVRDPWAAPRAGAPLDPYAAPAGASTSSRPALLDPYAAGGVRDPWAAPRAGAPLDPYAAPAGATPREVMAPPGQRATVDPGTILDPYAEPKVVTAPVGSEPLKGVPAPTSDAARAVAIRSEVLPLQRAQLQAAVASFDKLAKDHGFERTGRGVRILRVAPDSYAYGMGLRAGDHVTAIDGRPLRTLDDAAQAYVRIGTATRVTLDLERGAARGVLRFDLK